VIRYQITDGTGNIEAISAEADLVQIREPQLSIRELAGFVRAAANRARRILVNDRLDVALACGAAGAHLKGGSVPPRLCRQITPPGFLITVACHTADEVRSAEGADYVLVSPVFRPISKADARSVLGVAGLERIARETGIPVLALGGITGENAGACVRAGAAGVAGISLFLRGAHDAPAECP